MKIGQQVDIWSLGCVFSEVATWIVGGWTKVLEYRRRRSLEASDRLGKPHGAISHDGRKALNVVEENHTNMVKSYRRSDYITEDVLQNLVPDMLSERPEDRFEVARLYGRTDIMVSHAEKKALKDLNEAENEASSVIAIQPESIVHPINQLNAPGASQASEPPPRYPMKEALNYKRQRIKGSSSNQWHLRELKNRKLVSRSNKRAGHDV